MALALGEGGVGTPAPPTATDSDMGRIVAVWLAASP